MEVTRRDQWDTGDTEVWAEVPVVPGPGAKCEVEVAAVAEEGEEAGAALTRPRHDNTILLYKYPDTPNCIVLS